ncbi:MAG: TlpA family protein disulfide reductase, partial [Planctomycetota bacterium]
MVDGRRAGAAGTVLLLAAAIFLAAGGCGRKVGPRAPVDPLAGCRGKTIVLLMGMPGCPGTIEATRFLVEYSREKPEGVAVVRLDVAPPGDSLAEPKGGDAGFVHKLDRDRTVADRLEFFFYPTLYIIDKDGKVRFRGGCEPDRVKEMVAEITAERPGAAKRVYTPPMPAVGSAAAAFAGKDLAGKDVSLEALRGKAATLLFFGSAACPYSKDAVSSLPALAAEFGGKGAAVAVVNIGQTPKAIRPFYARQAPRITVVADETSDIGEKKYGVRSVPFFYVLDKAGKIAARRPFTPDAARMALAKTLG